MGRFKKVVNYGGIDKRETGYYSTPKFVADYIAKRMLQINPLGKKVLDPCCGKEELLGNFFGEEREVHGIDIIKYKEDYECNFQQNDFIELYSEWKYSGSTDDSETISLFNHESKLPLEFDYYIANPPYNCHEVDFIKNNKEDLKKIFDDVGVHNMYSMFISALIDCAKEGALIGLITLDSFFTAIFHKDLRKKILKYCTIHEITMCPTDLFLDQKADVRTSIVILQKGKERQGKIKVNNRPLTTEIFETQLSEDIYQYQGSLFCLEDIILNDKKDNDEFIIECPDDIKTLFKNKRIQDVFDCVTGISTGNDQEYLSIEQKEPFTIPFYKNPGKNRFYADNCLFLHNNFLNIDLKVKNFMVRNKHLLYKPGVTCSSMGVAFTACRLPEKSTYGVNANIICSDEDAWWLIAYLNSDLVTYIVRGVLIRSNMITSGYVSRIPLINFSKEEKEVLTNLSVNAYEKAVKKETYKDELIKINEIVYNSANVSKNTISVIDMFIMNLIKST